MKWTSFQVTHVPAKTSVLNSSLRITGIQTFISDWLKVLQQEPISRHGTHA